MLRYSDTLMRQFCRFASVQQAALLLCLALLVGCLDGTGVSTPTEGPTAVPPTHTPKPAESPVPTETPVPAATTEDTETSETSVVRIKNLKLGTYLYQADDQVKHGDQDSDGFSSQWAIEDFQGSKRIKNRATGAYISIEHLLGYVEAIAIEPGWMSPRWIFKPDAATGSVTLWSVWHNWEVLYVDDADDVLKYGRPPAATSAAQWVIETLEGEQVAAGTPTPVVSLPTLSGPLAERGALVPWIEYEAEDGVTNGEILGSDRTFGTIAAESSGRRSVQLNKTGDYVQFTSSQQANSIVVRYVIPDAPEGGGIDATISLYVNGVFRQKLDLTSKYAWSYGGEQLTVEVPAAKGEHHFFDEARALVDDIPAGATVRLQKDQDDTAEYYVIDLIDIEAVEAPKAQPADFYSITKDCGAVPDDGKDDGSAIEKCLSMAEEEGKGVWIPEGTFESTTRPFYLQDVTIQGAGMWYSVIHGFYARFECTGDNCRYSDFAILGETTFRDDESPENGFNGGAGRGSSLENIWVEHTKVGYWVGPGTTDGLIIRNSRFRNLFADGVNFSSGASHSVIENSHFRNTGDDALASWSVATAEQVNTNNVFRFNTVQLPWRANCFAIYGGKDNSIEDNLCYDVVTYPGILIAQDFASYPFAGTTTVQRNSLIRAGGRSFNQDHGALKIKALQGAIEQIVVKDMLIESPTFSGIELEGSYPIASAIFENIQIRLPGTWGIVIRSNVVGEAAFTEVIVSQPGKVGLLNNAPPLEFELIRESGNTGW